MKRFILSALALTAALSSCDVLDKTPLDRVSQFDYFKTATDLELFTNPYYNNLPDKEFFKEQSDPSSCRTPCRPSSSAARTAPCPNRAAGGRGRTCGA